MPGLRGAAAMGALWVVACSRCRQAKVCGAGQKTTTCGHCGRTLDLAQLKKHVVTEDPAVAAHAAGKLNAALAGNLKAFDAEAVPLPPPQPKGDRAAQARRVALDLALRGPFAAPDLAEALVKAGVQGEAEEHLERLLKAGVLYEPRRGRYAAMP
jgi:hypothetical protein